LVFVSLVPQYSIIIILVALRYTTSKILDLVPDCCISMLGSGIETRVYDG